MAVSTIFKPTAFAKLFDAMSSEYDALDQAGVKVVAKSDHFDIVGPGNENIVGNIGLNAGVIGIAEAGNLPGIAKAPVAAAIMASFKHALNSDNWASIVTADDVTDDGDIKLTTEDIDGTETPVFVDQSSDEVILEKAINKMSKQKADGSNLPKVKLEDAEALYQPVSSTSQGSTYYCVGIARDSNNEFIKFAARRKDQSLSIRVEGKVKKHKDVLVAAGFNEEYIAKGYTSVHFHGVDDLMAQRALGAVLFGTGLKFDTLMPDVSKIGGE